MNFDKIWDSPQNSYTLKSADIVDFKNYLLKKKGCVYIAQSKDTHFYKIGRTSKNPWVRAKTLSSAGVLHGYEIVFSLEFFNHIKAEQAVHKALDRYRVKTSKEFFQTQLSTAVEAVEKCYQLEQKLMGQFFNTEEAKDHLELLEHYLVDKSLKIDSKSNSIKF